MHLVRYHVAGSLDGFIAPTAGSTEWLEPYGKVAMGFISHWMKQIGGIIVGRATYDQAIGRGGWMWGKTPALVMTSRPILAGPQTIEAHTGDPAQGLARLRAHGRTGSRHRHLALRRQRHGWPVPKAQSHRHDRRRGRASRPRAGRATFRKRRNPLHLRSRRLPADRCRCDRHSYRRTVPAVSRRTRSRS